MAMSRTAQSTVLTIATMLLLAGCMTREENQVEPPEAAAAEPVAAVPTLAEQSIVVSDDPPFDLRFTSSLNARQRELVRSELADEMAGGRGSSTATAAGADLNGDGTDEVFIVIKASAWCGSGDVCNVWIFEQTGDGWTWLGDGEDAASCVSILPTATNGYRDIRLHGQCAVDMCTFDLRWDGSLYQWDGNRECDPIPELN